MNCRHVLAICAVLLVCASASRAQTVTPEAPAFPDVPRYHWAFEAVQRLAEVGILEGRPAMAMMPVPPLPPVLNTAAVKVALLSNPVFRGATIDVTTLPGARIQLNGTVRSAAAKKLATAIVIREAPGFTVVNLLKVKPAR